MVTVDIIEDESEETPNIEPNGFDQLQPVNEDDENNTKVETKTESKTETKIESKEQKASPLHLYCLLQAETAQLEAEILMICNHRLQTQCPWIKTTFCTRWSSIYPGLHCRHMPKESLSSLILSVGEICCSDLGRSVFLQLNITESNKEIVMERWLCEIAKLNSNPMDNFQTCGDLQIESLYGSTKNMPPEVQFLYHLLTEIEWSNEHLFHACVFKTKVPQVFGVQIPNVHFVLHHTHAYKRWKALLTLIESRDLDAFLFWMHRLFFFAFPLC